jgi:hypothetical protein
MINKKKENKDRIINNMASISLFDNSSQITMTMDQIKKDMSELNSIENKDNEERE